MIGVPFVHQGRSGAGVDCIGLGVVCAKGAGFNIDDRTDYPRQPDGQLIPAVSTHCHQVSGIYKPGDESNWLPGDVLAMRFKKDPQHLAIWTGETVIHCFEGVGKVVEHNLDDKWKRRIHSVWRLNE